MTRAEWQQLAQDRVLDAQAMLAAQRWSAAYYLAGYAVECALKSCILVRISAAPDILFREKRYSERCWTHGIEDLTNLADLHSALQVDIAANRALSTNWLIVKDWTEGSRYRQATQQEAEELYNAIADNLNGILPWIMTRW